MDTSHVISNIPTTVDDDTANARAYATAQHFPPGDGPKPERTRQALMMNRYDADLVRDGETSRIRRLTVDSAWFSGDPTVFLGE
ncbi:nuclear transport factor 2 family protein [Streptomyces sp. NPDC059568]|uniref:nuclear transport factor 2 family protein n=1 Tax=Streptomyces sp. NPDC059568 TaxID=3346868 RepID=UPI003675BD52